jgi:hypothetical protein
MHSLVPSWARRTSALLLLLSLTLSACGDIATPVAPTHSIGEGTIETMDPGESYCDDDLWANGCTAVGDSPPPPPPPPSWEPCTSRPEGCYGGEGPTDPGDGGIWIGGGGGSGGDGASELPGDLDGDGDAFDDGLGAFTMCVSAGLAALGAGIGTYAARLAYYDALTAYNTARIKYEHAPGDSNIQWALRQELYTAERELNTATWVLAGAAVTTAAVVLGVAAACAPFIPLPIP